MSPDRRKLALGVALTAAVAALYFTLDPSGETAVASAGSVEAEAQAAASSAPAADPPDTGAAAAAAPDLSGLRLHGLTATGAIIASAGGQRLVRLGREIVPGVTLEAVRQHHAVLATNAGRFELGLLGVAQAVAPGVAVPAAAPMMAAGAAPAAARRTEVLQYRFGLEPRRAGGRITGFAVRPGAEMPLLQRAGLKPGDIVIGVNGQTFDSEEKVMELAGEIAGSYTAEFDFERNGRRMRASLPVNPRP